MHDRLPSVIEIRSRNLPILQANAADPDKDRTGVSTSMLAHAETFLAVARFALDRDVAVFRASLAAAVRRKLSLFRRFNGGEPIDPSYVSMTVGSQLLLNSLASGDAELALEVARTVGGRPAIEKKNDHVFSRSLGYAVKHLLLRSDEEARQAIAEFERACARTKADQPYVGMLQALHSRDVAGFSQAVKELEAAHKKLAAGRWKHTEHELLSLWGIGLCNLAFLSGMSSSVTNRYVPPELLLSQHPS